MKHKIIEDVNVNVKHDHDFDKDDVEDIIDRITNSVLVLIAASTVASVVKKYL